MSKKFKLFKGYLLVEAIFALGMLGMIVGIYMVMNINLLGKNRQLLDQLTLYRALFEETQLYDITSGTVSKNRMINGQPAQIQFSKNKEKLIKVEIRNETNHFFISTEE